MQSHAVDDQQAANEGCIDEMHMELAPRLSAISSLAEVIEEFGQNHNIPETQIFFVNLEIDELMTNYVTYAYRKVDKPRMKVTLRAFANRIVLIVEDSGPPFNPLEAPEPDLTADIEKRQMGGMGLHLVRKYADQMDYRCIDQRNILSLEHKFESQTKGETT